MRKKKPPHKRKSLCNVLRPAKVKEQNKGHSLVHKKPIRFESERAFLRLRITEASSQFNSIIKFSYSPNDERSDGWLRQSVQNFLTLP